MRIVEIRDADDCIEGDFMKEVFLAEPITRAFIEHLGNLGDLQFMVGPVNPFFRADIPGKYNLSGIEGRNRIRVVLSRDDTEAARASLLDLLTNFPTCRSSDPGVTSKNIQL